jgi:regulatory protein
LKPGCGFSGMKKLTPQQAKERIQRYCAYQERSHQEVRNKLYQIGLSAHDAEELISILIVEGFLNEERFAKAFSGGKFRLKKWGRLKIENALEKKGVSKNCIKSGLKDIDAADYIEALKTILEQKSEKLEEANIYVKRDKLYNFAVAKGYEPELIWKLLREILPD